MHTIILTAVQAVEATTQVVEKVEPLLSLGEMITIGAMIASVTALVITNKNTSKATKEQLERLEKKQDKYNNLQERTMKAQESSKSAHNRLDDFNSSIQRFEDRVSNKLDSILNTLSEHVKDFHTKKED